MFRRFYPVTIQVPKSKTEYEIYKTHYLLPISVLDHEVLKGNPDLLPLETKEVVDTDSIVGVVAGVSWGVKSSRLFRFTIVDKVTLGVRCWCPRNGVICEQKTENHLYNELISRWL